MDLQLSILVIALLALIVVALLLKFAKKAAKWLLVLAIVITIFGALFGINVLQDVNEFREKFPKAQKLILLKDGNTILTGFAGKLTDSSEAVAFLNEIEIRRYQDYYNKNDLESIRGTYYKVILIDTRSFANKPLEIGVYEDKIPAKEVISMILSSNTFDRIVDTIIAMQKLPDTDDDVREYVAKNIRQQMGITSDAEASGLLFAYLLSSANDDSLFLFQQFKSGNARIYPETITFKLAQIIPESILQQILVIT